MAGSRPVERLATQAQRLRSLHVPGRPLVLPNAWDAESARRVVGAGFPVVATASAAIAPSLGYADHEGLPATQMFDAVARIARAVDVPVTADIESGYGLDGGELAERLIAAGAAGCNLEDTDHGAAGRLLGLEAQADRIERLRARARELGVPLVVNARVDVFAGEVGQPDARLGEAVRRGRAYRDAGADCVYPIMVADEATISALVEAFAGMINVYARPEAPPLARLAELGVARVSYGPWMHRLAMRSLDAALAAVAAGDDPY